ncbi:class I tRNA ligase family protein [Psychroflexus sediminis]|uniref:Leucine--tRNA ligase n=1 Tax=Psychroflexus sediminis TaxID=470826 RepID=A0A1G7USG5_9FLAO|nr:class I tRNA ligase family protein [Psychroflexus sediminis]SDG49680.1 leucyl-tRNA synthetase [Psychroflexus sediminis]
MAYDFKRIEQDWQKYWAKHQTFKAKQPQDFSGEPKPPFYVLDMFPYPSGAGLHVGHPLGYIASDIYARYKRHSGYNVLHPQGYDSFGLPAEQYAIQTGQHPAKTTEANIKRYREQLDKIGFSFDWSREVRTSDPKYYKWTQWIFIQLFESWYDEAAQKSKPISDLIQIFESEGNSEVQAVCDGDTPEFSAEDWKAFSDDEKEQHLLNYRLTYLAETEVNWCPALGTVLANDEIVNGVSERGGHTVVRKKMKQWSMRISAFAERLLSGLDDLDWSESLKETQKNWIGKSVGAQLKFKIQNSKFLIEAFTTRPDTIFGVSFITLAPEHDLVSQITTPEQKEAVDTYVKAAARRSERERMADVKSITGVFTGAFAEHPLTQKPIPIWIGDYVLASYGTGAVMAVPCGDQRDHDFAKHFGIPIPNVFQGIDISEEAYTDKTNTTKIANSDFLDGLGVLEAIPKAIEALADIGAGDKKINYRLRDAVFSRQRYWGEPFPVYYVNDLPKMIAEKHLPLKLPEVEKYLPTEDGAPPLGRATEWAWDTETNQVVSNDKIDHKSVFPLELNTMPGWAGSSWYLFRYMEEQNNRDQHIASDEALNYWKNVDLYIGGSEHATGHLLYSRFWTKFLNDRGVLPVDEPFKKLINQGMILGESAFVYRYKASGGEGRIGENIYITYDFVKSIKEELSKFENIFIRENGIFDKNNNIIDSEIIIKYTPILKKIFSLGQSNMLIMERSFDPIHVDVSVVNTSNQLDIEGLKKIKPEFSEAKFILSNGELYDANSSPLGRSGGDFTVSREVEKMSKSKFNVVNPDDVCEEYGADSLRLYEMFLGPIEQAKPWNTAGLSGVHNFLKKLWKLYSQASPDPSQGGESDFQISDEPGSKESLKTLHKTIKKVTQDIEDFSFNTSVSTFMICVNELTQQKCNSREILEPLAILISPYAPHIAEELWEGLGHSEGISEVAYPKFEEKYLKEDSKTYPISFNGKMRFTMDLSLDLSKDEIEEIVMADERTQKQLEGKTPKKVIIVPGKIVNIVG